MASSKNALGLIAARTILGGCLLLFGLNEFHGLLGSVNLGGEGLKFIQALQETGYLYYIVKALEIGGGLLLITGLFVPLANLMLFPILLNILLFHIFLDNQGLVVALIMMVCSTVIFWYYNKLFLFLLDYNLKIDPNSIKHEDAVPKV